VELPENCRNFQLICRETRRHYIINGIPVENQESRSVKLKNLYDIFYSDFSSISLEARFSTVDFSEPTCDKSYNQQVSPNKFY
jgi:hypothetical protein